MILFSISLDAAHIKSRVFPPDLFLDWLQNIHTGLKIPVDDDIMKLSLRLLLDTDSNFVVTFSFSSNLCFLGRAMNF